MKRLLPVLLVLTALAATCAAAELPIREVILYRHGVGFFARSGKLAPGESARLDFKAEDMNDVLKSLILTDRQGSRIGGVRYDASEPLADRLKDFPFAVGASAPLTAFLDQLKGSRIELKLGAESAAGLIVSARIARAADKERAEDRETVTLLTDAGELRTFGLAGAADVKFADAKLQELLRDYLNLLSQSRSKDRRSLYIDAAGSGARELVASYLTPAPVWKSSYRLLLTDKGEPTLEGWAIVDNVSGEDWNGVHLSVVSGRPISFVTNLYEPRTVARPTVELAENRAAAPRLFSGAIESAARPAPSGLASAMRARKAQAPRESEADEESMAAGPGGALGAAEPQPVTASSMAATAQGRDAGALFEYNFPAPVTVKKGQSAMLPFLQQRLQGRKLLIYAESFGLNPQNAAEITNSTGKTLDGGPITVYDGGAYAGEALVETVKAGDRRLISYGVDLGTRISTVLGSSKTTVREIHVRRGILTSRMATEETKNYSIRNVDAAAKALIIEHPLRPGLKLIEPAKAAETTESAYRFEVKLAPAASQSFAVREERLQEQTVAISSMTPNVLVSWMQNKVLSPEALRQLEVIAAKKRESAQNDTALSQADAAVKSLDQDQDRLRRNIESLRKIQGQSQQVEQYSKQLAANELKIVALRDSQGEMRAKKTALESELNALIEKTEF